MQIAVRCCKVAADGDVESANSCMFLNPFTIIPSVHFIEEIIKRSSEELNGADEATLDSVSYDNSQATEQLDFRSHQKFDTNGSFLSGPNSREAQVRNILLLQKIRLL